MLFVDAAVRAFVLLLLTRRLEFGFRESLRTEFFTGKIKIKLDLV